MSIKLKIQSLWDGKGAKEAQAELGKVEAAAKKTEATAVSGAGKIGGAYKRLSSTMQSAWRVAMGPLAVITAAIAVITRAVSAWRRRQEELREEHRKHIQLQYDQRIGQMAAAMERLNTATRDAAEAANIQNRELLESIDIAEQAALADIEFQRAKALAAADPDDDIARARITARFDRAAADVQGQSAGQRTDAQAQAAQEEARQAEQARAEAERIRQGLEAQAQKDREDFIAIQKQMQEARMDAETDSASTLIRFLEREGLRFRGGSAVEARAEKAAGRFTPQLEDLTGKGDDPDDRGRMGRTADALRAARVEEERLAEQARQASQRAERIEQRGQIDQVRQRAGSVIAETTERDIDRRERDQRERARREAAEQQRRADLDAARAAAEPALQDKDARLSRLQARHGALTAAAQDPAQTARRRAGFAEEAQTLQPQIAQLSAQRQALQALIRAASDDDAALHTLLQRYIQRQQQNNITTANAIKRNDA